MIRFDILSIFPEVFDYYFRASIIRRAQEKRLIQIHAHNIRDFTLDAHRTTDDKPFGGGPGMIMKPESIWRCVRSLLPRRKWNLVTPTGRLAINDKRIGIILFSASGKQFDQRMAERFAKLRQLILICGRYEGVDARIARYIAHDEVSVGPYVLSGGEVPAMLVVDAVARLTPGVLGNADSLIEESFSSAIRLKPYAVSHKNRPTAYGLQHKAVGEYPQYTRPEIFYPGSKNGPVWRVPKVLLSGNHKRVALWRARHSK